MKNYCNLFLASRGLVDFNSIFGIIMARCSDVLIKIRLFNKKKKKKKW